MLYCSELQPYTMKHKTLLFAKWASCLLLGALLTGCPGTKKTVDPEALMQEGAASSHYQLDFSASQPKVIEAGGDSGIDGLQLESTSGLTFDADNLAHKFVAESGNSVLMLLDLRWPSMFQIAMEVNFDGLPTDATIFTATVNNKEFPFHVLESYDYTSHMVAVQIPESDTRRGQNTIEITQKVNVTEGQTAGASPYLETISLLPQKIISSGGSLNTTLYTQFGQTYLLGGTDVGAGYKWTRAYGLTPTMEMIPGPTLYYRKGDLLNVKMINLLNPDSSQALRDYQAITSRNLNPDETLAGDQVRGEVNIPHNLNNTNLHVHGLHVDPSKDDVTIVIVPEGADTTGYDAPHTHAPVDNDLGLLDSTSVSDQGIKQGKWLYSYKIPETHLPGTHWFHPHKHGSTSTQVENGLAGTMVIMEADTDAIVPHPGLPGVIGNDGFQVDYDLEEWLGAHDRVMAIQEITNFGLQPGGGNNKGLKIDSVAQSNDPTNQTNTIDLTVNGIDSLVLNIQPGQLERWRFVNAGTNHRAFSHLWLAKKTNETHKSVKAITNSQGTVTGYKTVETVVYEPANMYLVAVDGITLPAMDTVTADKPALLAPGNRSDFLVRFDTEGEYVLFKNYQPSNQNISIKQGGEIVYSYPDTAATTFPPAIIESQGKNNAFLFPQTGTTPTNYAGFTKNWRASKGSNPSVNNNKPVTPIIRVKEVNTDTMNYVELDFADSADFGTNSVGQFTPINFNDAGVTDAEILWVNVKKNPNKPVNSPLFPSNEWLSYIAPTTSTRAPAYVAPITNDDILQSRPVVFDVSGAAVKVDNDTTTSTINQFTLNGRFFELNDPIGNPKAPEKIATGYGQPKQFVSPTDQTNITQKLTFVDAVPIQWYSNEVGDEWFFTNPGYYQGIKKNGSGSSAYYSFDGQNRPTWKDVSGITGPAVINEKSYAYKQNKDSLPGLPMAKTAEEWVLINNSDVSHPFHIHINPFFIVEVGQLSYEQYKDASGATKYDWFMRAATADNEYGDWIKRDKKPATGAVPGSVYQGDINVPAIVGNWWDTIIIPSHGYVKVRYWFNVPFQTGKGTATGVTDNYNRTGIWVYHCHILRHEDRGMMMPVITMKNAMKEEDE